jgi:hypothetical protein
MAAMRRQNGWERVPALRPGQAVMVAYRDGVAEGRLDVKK